MFGFINLLKMGVKIMQGLDDLKVAVTGLTSTVSSVKSMVSSLQSQVASLQATIAAGGDNDADVEAQAKAVADQVTALNVVVNPPSAPAAGS